MTIFRAVDGIFVFNSIAHEADVKENKIAYSAKACPLLQAFSLPSFAKNENVELDMAISQYAALEGIVFELPGNVIDVICVLITQA